MYKEFWSEDFMACATNARMQGSTEVDYIQQQA
jgi:hypothetical protein